MNTKQLILLMGLAISTTLFPLDEAPMVDEKTITTILKEINSRIQQNKDRSHYISYYISYNDDIAHRIYCRILERKDDSNEYLRLLILKDSLERMESNASTKDALHSAIDSTIKSFTCSDKTVLQILENNKKELCDLIETGKLATYSNIISEKTEECTVDSSTHNVFI